MQKFCLLCVSLACIFGCASVPMTHGIPNFAQIDSTVWRGGQPSTSDSWAYLKSLGVTRSIKLNEPLENPEAGNDDGAAAFGIEVVPVPLPPRDDLPLDKMIADAFKHPDPSLVIYAADLLAAGHAFLHCKHGQDRTGIVAAVYRVRHSHWSKEQAYQEMLDRGFHTQLPGLSKFWWTYDPNVDYGTPVTPKTSYLLFPVLERSSMVN